MHIGLGLGITSLAVRQRSSVSIAALLFTSSEPGFWYDFSDTSTLFQDTAGTQPVTAPGQTVALALDKSKGLVLGPELVTNGTFDTDTAWTKGTGWTISGGTANSAGSNAFQSLSQAGVTTNGSFYEVIFTVTCIAGSLLIRVGGGTNHYTVGASGTFRVLARADGGTLAFLSNASGFEFVGTIDNISVREIPGAHATQPTAASRPTYGIVPATGRRNILLSTDTLATQTRTVTAVQHTLSFRGTGTVTLSGASTSGPLVGTGASEIVSLTFTPTAGSLTLTVSGTVELAQLEKGATRTGYQSVTTQYNVTEAGVPSLGYLQADGVDDFMVTPTITPGTDKVQAFAGVRKLSDAGQGIIAEHGLGDDFFLIGPLNSGTSTYGLRSGGTIITTISAAGYVAPITNVVSGFGDISGDLATLRVNGAQVAQSVADQGTGNYLAHPAYLFRRGGTTLPFNGQTFQLVGRFGPNLDAETIEAVEALVQAKTPENV